MTTGVFLFLLLVALIGTGFWWRYRSVACPARFAWLLENPYMKAVAGADAILDRVGLQPGMRVLDVGCGPGRLTLPAAARVGPEGEVIALDIQPAMLVKLEARARSAGIDNIRLVEAGAGQGAVAPEAFDRALLVTVLGEIPDPAAALAEIDGALKAGGILSVTEVIPDPHYTRRDTVRRLCSRAGLREVGSFEGRLAFTLNFEKSASGEAD